MNLHPEADIEAAKREVGKNEGDIVSYVRSQEPNPLRGNDLRFCGRLGQPSLSQASAAETGVSSRPRSGGRRRSSGSSSTGGIESSVPSPTPYQLGLEKHIKKQNKKLNKYGSVIKKLIGMVMCGGGQNTGTARQEEIKAMTAEMESSEDEDEDEVEVPVEEVEDEIERTPYPIPDAFHDITLQQPDPYMGYGDSLTDSAMRSIFGPPPDQRQTGIFIRTPGEHPEGTRPGPAPVDEPATASKGAKDKGKAKMVVRRRSTRRSNARPSNAEEEGSSPEPE